jgi:hypothetical protein
MFTQIQKFVAAVDPRNVRMDTIWNYCEIRELGGEIVITVDMYGNSKLERRWYGSLATEVKCWYVPIEALLGIKPKRGEYLEIGTEELRAGRSAVKADVQSREEFERTYGRWGRMSVPEDVEYVEYENILRGAEKAHWCQPKERVGTMYTMDMVYLDKGGCDLIWTADNHRCWVYHRYGRGVPREGVGMRADTAQEVSRLARLDRNCRAYIDTRGEFISLTGGGWTYWSELKEAKSPAVERVIDVFDGWDERVDVVLGREEIEGLLRDATELRKLCKTVRGRDTGRVELVIRGDGHIKSRFGTDDANNTASYEGETRTSQISGCGSDEYEIWVNGRYWKELLDAIARLSYARLSFEGGKELSGIHIRTLDEEMVIMPLSKVRR